VFSGIKVASSHVLAIDPSPKNVACPSRASEVVRGHRKNCRGQCAREEELAWTVAAVRPTSISRIIEVSEKTGKAIASHAERKPELATMNSVAAARRTGMRSADDDRMHVIAFTLKRSNQAASKVLQAIAAREGLTPARFDLLYTLHLTRYRAPFQFRIAEWLGVARPTICKMIRALRKIGLVEIRPDAVVRKRKRISLTRVGRRLFARLLRVVRRGQVRAAMRAAYCALGEPRKAVRMLLAEIVDRVERFSRGLDEFTTLYRADSV
ncbi:MAG: MarR family winged helix-turn-helix transcriptional regulator, partial [Polyangiaceae bacterium]